MDHTEEQYDPDGDVSRFLDSPDHPGMLLSPMPLLSEEVNETILSSLPQEVLHHDPVPQLPEQALQEAPLLLPHHALSHVPSQFTQQVLQQAPVISSEEVVQQVPDIIFPQEEHQQNPSFDGISSVPVVNHMETEVLTAPLSVEGMIIASMQGIPLEGSSSSNPRNDSMFELIFQHYLPGHRDCSECVTLRIVSHTSPIRNLFFTVHGGAGTFDHVVFDVEYFGRDGRQSTRERLYMELSMRSLNWIKSFILGFTTLLQSDRSGTVHDSVSSFYNTLCADMNTTTMGEMSSMNLASWYRELPDLGVEESTHTEQEIFVNGDSSFDLPVSLTPTMMPSLPQFSLFGTIISPAMPEPGVGSSSNSAGSSIDTAIVIPDGDEIVPAEPAPDARRRPPVQPSHIAIQRKRTASMRLPDLVAYLHLPIEEAANRLSICSTALKKICRRNGKRKWPSRQIQAVNRKLVKLEKVLLARSHMLTGLFAIKEEMDKLQAEKMEIYQKWLQNINNNDANNADENNDEDDDDDDDDGNATEKDNEL